MVRESRTSGEYDDRCGRFAGEASATKGRSIMLNVVNSVAHAMWERITYYVGAVVVNGSRLVFHSPVRC